MFTTLHSLVPPYHIMNGILRKSLDPMIPIAKYKIPSQIQLNKRQKILQLYPVFPGHQNECSSKMFDVQLP